MGTVKSLTSELDQCLAPPCAGPYSGKAHDLGLMLGSTLRRPLFQQRRQPWALATTEKDQNKEPH